MMTRRTSLEPSRPSRRTFLAASAGLGVGALTGCGGGFGDGGGDSGGSGGELKFDIPDPDAKFPTDDVTLRLVDSNDTKAPFWEQFFEAYQTKHDNVTCQYDGLPWNRIEEVVPLGIRNGSAHDLIQLPGTIPLSQAVAEGWVSPVDEYIPNFAEWQKRIPASYQVEGFHVFEGKQYLVPLGSDQRHFQALHYNKQLMNDAGFDPQSEPLTWDTYREAARKVTKQNDGQAYGVILEIAQPGRLVFWVEYMARMAGLPIVGNILQPSGEFHHDSDEIVEAIELLLALKSDGSLFPGSNSLTAPECWPRVARGNAAMVSAGPWVTVTWERDNPDFEFGVGDHPHPNDDPWPVGYLSIGGDALTMFSGSKVKEVAGDVLGYVTSLDGQTRWGEITGAGNPPVLDEARKASAESYSEQGKKCVELADAMVANPEPIIANPDVALVSKREKPVDPDFAGVIQAALVGEISDLRGALRDLKDRSEKARDAAIAEAKKLDGSTATREDWIFPNWDPKKDYTVEDYQGR
ncbi:carbohydrate ABC transporter substrate-binding protein (CUT1 family) [Haloactinopolyspora alba]|uniref:Carbohydrate ABC transporter substrate-binding protein (CUT1 family) n=1 Tax=Haloactinopolyspora alba TaxID=648780 RepID=A0A2P8EG24_9ACTN|nr:extracellular solute-binding protein [Haloactinopolyspora alba]PSL08417.1 carbohydrate ABC transporter substrate-binding protein (CUT1 family) [Haloactinopolyspora alba]